MTGREMVIGFFGLGVMGLPMARNVLDKSGCRVYGYDLIPEKTAAFINAGGETLANPDDIYKRCNVIIQMLPTHEDIQYSTRRAAVFGPKDSIIIDCSSAAPDVILELNKEVSKEGKHLLDSPVSGGNPMAIAGTLAIMTGGEKTIFDQVKPILSCMGTPVYTGSSGSGDTTKLINNTIGGAYLAAIAEGYAFASKAGIDLQTTFEATRGGFAGGPLYDNKVPKIIHRDYTPGARIAVHRKDILNAKHYAHRLGIDLPVTDVTLRIMDWMNDNGYIDFDQAAMVKYFEEKMEVTVGK